ncbi:NAD-dependent epimerase/dehydratase family protein [Terasakiella sp. SH-1]|uniref:NAD-dependent epimerase/dehydratase family protein n=1 Tax=Terasakiella sp. SH-1 TaxID=2560057 RepID=UPI00107464ED|nr:NAD-dependent epimerase/dehydratase family protein [Terasakiella sp. SH-1]
MAKYLVTGGCGFIGSHLCEALLRGGHSVVVLDNLSTGKRENLMDGIDLQVGDVADYQDVEKAMAGVDGCFHLAAIASVEKSIEDWPQTHKVNLSGTINIFDVARIRKVPVVYASSAAVYGDNANVPLSETDRTRPLSAYGADKLGCEYHAKVAGLIHGVPTTGLRFFNVFGPRQDPKSPYSGVISIFIDRLLAGKTLKIFGDGQQVRDFVYVGDVVRFLVAAMERTTTEADVFNVCTGQTTSINQLAKAIATIAGFTPSIDRYPARGGDIQMSLGNPEKARKKLKVGSITNLSEGLKETVLSQLGPTSHAAE